MIYDCPRCGAIATGAGVCPVCAKARQYITMRPKSQGPGMLLANVSVQDVPRVSLPTFPHLENALYGGFVPGTTFLLHGGPGVGKSTLALQLCERIGRYSGALPLYVTTEQMLSHVKMAAVRLGLDLSTMFVSATQDFADVVTSVNKLRPQFVVVDSLQNLNLFDPYDGTRLVAVCRALVNLSHDPAYQIALVIVCHETKEDEFAGPRTLEHLVDGIGKLSVCMGGGRGADLMEFTVYSKYRFGPIPRSAMLARKDNGGFYEWPDQSRPRSIMDSNTNAGGIDRRRSAGASPEGEESGRGRG